LECQIADHFKVLSICSSDTRNRMAYEPSTP
jgi:hypothetical protein